MHRAKCICASACGGVIKQSIGFPKMCSNEATFHETMLVINSVDVGECLFTHAPIIKMSRHAHYITTALKFDAEHEHSIYAMEMLARTYFNWFIADKTQKQLLGNVRKYAQLANTEEGRYWMSILEEYYASQEARVSDKSSCGRCTKADDSM